MGESNELKNRYLHVRWNTIKQDIENPKQDIEEVKQNIGLHIELSAKTKQHIEVLFTEFGYEKYFGRMDVMEILGITASPASTLIKKMLDMELIYGIKGKGKGKYLKLPTPKRCDAP